VSDRDNAKRYNSTLARGISPALSLSCKRLAAGSRSIDAADRLDIITGNPQGHRIARDWPFPWLSVIVNGHSWRS